MYISDMRRKNSQILFISYIIAFELVMVNSSYYEEKTCHRQSMCYQIVLGCEKSLRFSDSILPKVMKQDDEGAAMQFFGLFNMLTVEGCSKTWLLRYLTNQVFRSL